MRAAFGHLWHWRTGLGLVLGGAGGAVYSLTVGCTTGGCFLTANPVIAGIAGALLGVSLLAPAKRPPAPSGSTSASGSTSPSGSTSHSP